MEADQKEVVVVPNDAKISPSGVITIPAGTPTVITKETSDNRRTLRSIETWVKGLTAAAIGGGANAISLMIVDPVSFNLADWHKLAKVCAVSALVSAAMFLKQSPVPS